MCVLLYKQEECLIPVAKGHAEYKLLIIAFLFWPTKEMLTGYISNKEDEKLEKCVLKKQVYNLNLKYIRYVATGNFWRQIWNGRSLI